MRFRIRRAEHDGVVRKTRLCFGENTFDERVDDISKIFEKLNSKRLKIKFHADGCLGSHQTEHRLSAEAIRSGGRCGWCVWVYP